MADEKVYVPRPHVVTPMGVLWEGPVAIKRYLMVPQGQSDLTALAAADVEAVNGHIKTKLSRGSIYRGVGLGFSILSDTTMNVCTWGGKNPSLLNQAVYSFKPMEVRVGDADAALTVESLAESGTFCCWELGIVAHEGAAWRRFLLSQQTPDDRDAYLTTRFQGIVR